METHDRSKNDRCDRKNRLLADRTTGSAVRVTRRSLDELILSLNPVISATWQGQIVDQTGLNRENRRFSAKE
jgi:hypothetical protein